MTHKEDFENLCKGFMIPEIVVNQDFYLVSDEYGDQFWIPDFAYQEGKILERNAGYFARLSAPGYLDCTEWNGPFETELEAEEYLVEMYGE